MRTKQPQSERLINVRVRSRTSNAIYRISYTDEDTILDIKKKLSKQANIPVVSQRLIFAGKNCPNFAKAEEFKFHTEGMADLVQKPLASEFSEDTHKFYLIAHNFYGAEDPEAESASVLFDSAVAIQENIPTETIGKYEVVNRIWEQRILKNQRRPDLHRTASLMLIAIKNEDMPSIMVSENTGDGTFVLFSNADEPTPIPFTTLCYALPNGDLITPATDKNYGFINQKITDFRTFAAANLSKEMQTPQEVVKPVRKIQKPVANPVLPVVKPAVKPANNANAEAAAKVKGESFITFLTRQIDLEIDQDDFETTEDYQKALEDCLKGLIKIKQNLPKLTKDEQWMILISSAINNPHSVGLLDKNINAEVAKEFAKMALERCQSYVEGKLKALNSVQVVDFAGVPEVRKDISLPIVEKKDKKVAAPGPENKGSSSSSSDSETDPDLRIHMKKTPPPRQRPQEPKPNTEKEIDGCFLLNCFSHLSTLEKIAYSLFSLMLLASIVGIALGTCGVGGAAIAGTILTVGYAGAAGLLITGGFSLFSQCKKEPEHVAVDRLYTEYFS